MSIFEKLSTLFDEQEESPVKIPLKLRIIYAILGGACVFLAFPNYDQFWLAYIALALELWAIEGAKPKTAFLLGLLAGSVTNLGGFYWVGSLLHDFGHMPMAVSWILCSAFCILQGLVYALWAWGIRKSGIRNIWVTAPALFIAIEMFFPMLFPWYYGNSQYNFIYAIQTADIFGVLGVTLLVTVVNVLIFDVTRTLYLKKQGMNAPWHKKSIIAAMAYILISFIYAPIRINHVDSVERDAPKLNIGMVEGDVGVWETEPPEKLRNNLFIHQRLSHELALEGVDLIVWPESAYMPGFIWGSRLKREEVKDDLQLELDSLYSPWFQPKAHLIYRAVDAAFGDGYHRNPVIHHSLETAMNDATQDYGYTNLEPYYPSYVSGFPAPCNEDFPQTMKCPYYRLVPDDMIYYLPSAEPLRESRRLDLLSQIRPEDINSPLRGFNTPILTGTLSIGLGQNTNVTFDVIYKQSNKERQLYNTAHLIDKDGMVLGTYHKNYPLLFGEYVPLADDFPWMYELLPMAGNLTAGTEIETMHFKGYEIGPIICYEDILPRFVRDLSKLNPHVFVNMTNDAWFGKTSEPMLHLALAMMRTVEHRKWLVRSTNTGISAFVDPNGRLVQQTSMYEPEILRQSVAMMPLSRTVYSYIGDVLGWVASGWCLMLVIVGMWRRKNNKKNPTPA